MNERLQILTLLEEGKINAQEAERLLEALSHSGSRDKKSKFKIWNSLEDIPRVISAAIGNAIDDTKPGAPMEYTAPKRLVFKGISGDLDINGMDTDKMSIQKDGYAKIKEHDDELVIKALSGDVKIDVPHNTDISVAGISGDVRIAAIKGTLHIKSVSGDITGKNLSGSLVGEFVSGDVDLDYESVEEISIKAESGDVTLMLDEKVEADINIESDEGKITCDFELKDKVEEENLLSGIINEPGAKLKIKNRHGDVLVKKRV